MLAEGVLELRKRSDIFSAPTRGSNELEKLKKTAVGCLFFYDLNRSVGKRKEEKEGALFITF